MKWPLDRTPYPKDPRSVPVSANCADGGYVYVQDINGTVFVVPDGPHLHTNVLGGGRPALYAGDLTIAGGKVIDLTNLLGSFRFDDEEGLKDVAEQIRQQGVGAEAGAVRFFPADGSRLFILE